MSKQTKRWCYVRFCFPLMAHAIPVVCSWISASVCQPSPKQRVRLISQTISTAWRKIRLKNERCSISQSTVVLRFEVPISGLQTSYKNMSDATPVSLETSYATKGAQLRYKHGSILTFGSWCQLYSLKPNTAAVQMIHVIMHRPQIYLTVALSSAFLTSLPR